MYSSDSEEAARDTCVDVCPRDEECAAEATADDAHSVVDELPVAAGRSETVANDAEEAADSMSLVKADNSRFVDDDRGPNCVNDHDAGSSAPVACVEAVVESPVIDSLPIEAPPIDSAPIDGAPEGTPVACEVSEATEVAEGIEAARVDNRKNGESAAFSEDCAVEGDAVRESAVARKSESASCPPVEAGSATSRRNQIEIDENRFEMEEPKRPLMAVMAQGTSLAASATARPGLQRMVSAKRSPAPQRPAAPPARAETSPPRAVARPKNDDNDFDLGLGPSPAGPPEAAAPGREGYESQSGAGGKVMRGWRGLMNVFKPNQRAPKPRS